MVLLMLEPVGYDSSEITAQSFSSLVCSHIIHYISYAGGCEWSDFGEASPIQMLTGWLPHTITIR